MSRTGATSSTLRTGTIAASTSGSISSDANGGRVRDRRVSVLLSFRGPGCVHLPLPDLVAADDVKFVAPGPVEPDVANRLRLRARELAGETHLFIEVLHSTRHGGPKPP